MKKKNLLLTTAVAVALSTSFTACKKKEGCTDPAATNYDADAKKDDGSCEYPTSNNDNTNNSNEVVVKDNGNGTGTTTWTNDKVWILDGMVFVNPGQTLTIEPGTVIKGKPGTGANASALIVARGGKIMAQGTASQPIIFTFEADPLDGSVPVTTRGQWGGLIVLGNAQLNSSPGESQIEGIPTSETRGLYGGNDDADNSGIIQYVSIRHGGTDIGAGNEINGLTLGGVGYNTVIDHVEIVANADDGIEFFGGQPRVKNAIIAFCGDDGYDYDEGFRGYGQFWWLIQEPGAGDRGGEHDGGTSPEDGMPYAHPKIYNATYMGRGASAGKRAVTFRDNAGGEYHNSIFMDYAKGIDIEMLASGEYSYKRWQQGDLVLEDNVFWNVADGTAAGIFKVSFGSGASANPDSATAASTFASYFATANNTVADPGLSNNFAANGYNPVPGNAANVSGGTAPTDAWFDNVTYKGAFDPNGTNWAKGWTYLDERGYFQ
ncbi:MAG TPA: hypothetical protein DIU39_03385 [Flavobacteriales bacterium]|nr:hypothetical protein [Flavobacteriales bacterium]|tara:strand:- start:278 stop:1747 length:1470 start_codon:yes stop_codon:yes gene_type:complete